MLHYRLHCSCLISVPSVHTSVHTSLFMFHCYFLCSRVHLIHFGYHSPSCSCLSYLVAFILHGHSTALSVSLFGGSRLGVSGLRVSLDGFLIFGGYSLLGAGLWWFCCSLGLGSGGFAGPCLFVLGGVRRWGVAWVYAKVR